MDASSPSVLFLAPEPVGPELTGPARRALKLAEAVARRCDVTLAAPSPSAFPPGPFRTLETGPVHDQRLDDAFAAHDIAVVQTLPSPRLLLSAALRARRLVADLIAPLALEAIEMGRDRDAVVRLRVRQMLTHLWIADLVLCSNERQRDLLVGAALAGGVVAARADLAPLQERIVVVPHGLDIDGTRRKPSRLRTGQLAGDGVRIAVWGGGIWSWFDPLTAIRAVERLRERRPDLRLAFVGLDHPDPAQRAAHAGAADAARRYVAERHLDDVVVFRTPWLGRDDFLDHLADADVGVSLGRPTAEARYATRTRVLDYLEVGLPVVSSDSDTMADVIVRHGLGRAVPPGDVDACAQALDALTAAPSRADGGAAALEALSWRNVARPLVDYCLTARPPDAPRRSASLAHVVRQYPAFLRSVHTDGGFALARAASRSAARLVRARSSSMPR